MSKQDAVDLVKHQLKKYTIAVAITVLKSKPKNTSTADYCQIIQQKILEGNQSHELSVFNYNHDTEYGYDENEFSTIFDSQDMKMYSPSQEAIPLFNKFVADSSESLLKSKGNTNYINFNVLKAIKNAKDIICHLNGTFSSTEDTYFASKMDNIKNSESTQESGYQSNFSQRKDCFYKIDGNIDYVVLNKSFMLLLKVLTDAPENRLSDSMIKYISEVLGRLTDVLHKNCIDISSFDRLFEIIELFSEQLFASDGSLNSKIDSHQKSISKFFLLNESYLTLRHSIKTVMKQIEHLAFKLSCVDSSEEIELSDPDFTRQSHLIFFVTERLFKKYSVCRMQFTVHSEIENSTGQYSSEVYKTQRLDGNENDNFDANYTNILNRIALECVETYPLISFWALECLNILQDN